MPTRMLWEKICTSRTLATLSSDEERFFIRLLVQCDDHGRFHAEPSILRARCFARMLDDVSDSAVLAWRDRLADVGLLDVYAVDGEEYLAVTTWGAYQRRRDSKSRFPDPPQSAAVRRNLPQDADVADTAGIDGGSLPDRDGFDGDVSPQLAAESGSRVVKTVNPGAGGRRPVNPGAGEREPRKAAKPPTTPTTLDASHDDVLVPAPVTGFHAVLVGTQGYAPSPAFFEQVTERYGSLDLREEALKMRAWLADPAQNRRHKSATTNFVLGWLKRELEGQSSKHGARSPSASLASSANGAAKLRAPVSHKVY